jgi:hypothetical protein
MISMRFLAASGASGIALAAGDSVRAGAIVGGTVSSNPG